MATKAKEQSLKDFEEEEQRCIDNACGFLRKWVGREGDIAFPDMEYIYSAARIGRLDLLEKIWALGDYHALNMAFMWQAAARGAIEGEDVAIIEWLKSVDRWQRLANYTFHICKVANRSPHARDFFLWLHKDDAPSWPCKGICPAYYSRRDDSWKKEIEHLKK